MPKRCELEKITEIERQNSLEPVLKYRRRGILPRSFPIRRRDDFIKQAL